MQGYECAGAVFDQWAEVGRVLHRCMEMEVNGRRVMLTRGAMSEVQDGPGEGPVAFRSFLVTEPGKVRGCVASA